MADYATLLRDRVSLSCQSIDRIFLQAYVPKLQSMGLVGRFLRWQRKFFVPSSAAFGKIGDSYGAKVHKFAADHDIPVIFFDREKKKRKQKVAREDVARPYIDTAAREGGAGRVVLIGIAQEKASTWRSWKAKGQDKAPHVGVALGVVEDPRQEIGDHLGERRGQIGAGCSGLRLTWQCDGSWS